MANILPALSRTASDVVAEIKMTRTAFAGAIILCEGPSDSRFFMRHLKPGCTQITICGGKQTVLGATTLLTTLGISGFLAIVDRDFDDHRGVNFNPPIFVTDTHDIETMMLEKRIDTLLMEVGDPPKIRQFEILHGTVISDALLAKCESFAKIRFVNDVQPGLGMDLTGLSAWKYTDIHTWVVDEAALTRVIATLSGRTVDETLQLLATVPALKSWKDARGHDAMALLSIGLRKVLGGGKQVSENQLAGNLRLAFSETDFAATKLYRALKDWETATGLPLFD